MKKTLLFLLALVGLGCAEAQTITWGEAVTAGESKTYKFADPEEKLILEIKDENSKVSAKGNRQFFGDENSQDEYTFQLKVGGKTAATLVLSLTVPADGTLKIAARPGTASDTRTFTLEKTGVDPVSTSITEADKITGDITIFKYRELPVTAGVYNMTFNGSVLFYGITLVPSETEGGEGTEGDGKDDPTEGGEENPGEGEVNPGEGEETPGEGEETPGEGEETPGETVTPEQKTWFMSDIAAATYTDKFTTDGLTVYASADKYVTVEGNNKTFDGVKYTARLKTSGSSKFDSDGVTPLARVIAFNVPGSCIISAAILSQSKTEDRTVTVAYVKDNALVNIGTMDALVTTDEQVKSVKYEGEATTIYLYVSDGVAFYMISYAPIPAEEGGDNNPTAVRDINIANPDAHVYNLAGQRVSNLQSGKIYIQNGKKFIVK